MKKMLMVVSGFCVLGSLASAATPAALLFIGFGLLSFASAARELKPQPSET